MFSKLYKSREQDQEGQQNITLNKLVKFSHYETIFKYVFFVVLSIIAAYSFDIIEFQKFIKDNNIRRFDWYEVKWLFIGLIVIHITKELNRIFATKYIEESLDKKYTGLDRQLRVRKIVKWTYDGIYYSSVTIFGFVVFRNEKWFPTEFGGQNFQETFYDYPNYPDVLFHITQNPWVPMYYMVQTASHVHALLLLMIHGTKIELKYWEYLLHHFLAVSLLYFSTMYNCEMIGVVVLILHDISDIFLSIGRVYGDCGKKKLLVYFWYSSILISWIYTRVYVFPVKIWDCILNHHQFIPYWENTKHAFISQVGLMIVLFGMHVYWTIFMLKVGSGIFSAGKYKNVYDNRENKLDHKKKEN